MRGDDGKGWRKTGHGGSEPDRRVRAGTGGLVDSLMRLPAGWRSRPWLPAFATIVWYAVLQTGIGIALGIWLRPLAVPLDLGLQTAIAYCLWSLSRRTWAFLTLHGLLMLLLHVGHALKIAFYGGPISPDDAASLPAFLMILEGPVFVGVVALLSAITVILVANLRLDRRALPGVAGIGALALALTVAPGPMVRGLDMVFGDVGWSQRINYEIRGGAIQLVQEGARRLAAASAPPAPDEAQAAAALLLGPEADTLYRRAALDLRREATVGDVPRRKRNVHVIVLESFWDAGQLTGAGLTEDPLGPEFRALWAEAGNSRALSPVFGGHTANSEFELLCGFPVMEEGVEFEQRLRRDAPCLPRLLGEAGYATVASHPNVAAFWNRIHAYRRVGFDTYWSDRDFELDDMNGEFLSDRSLYRQVLAKVEPLLETETPTFNYILTFFGHVGYPLNEQRPQRIGHDGAVWLVGPYANTVRYKAQEFVEMVRTLRARDPDALIVAFGDHLPFLGFNFDGYTQSGLLPTDLAEATADQRVTYSATPLIVIDGRRGPLSLGDVPVYQISSMILDLIGYDQPTIMDYARAPAGVRIRPFPGSHLVMDPQRGPVLCRDGVVDEEGCGITAAWLSALDTVKRDLFRGGQWSGRAGGPWEGQPVMARPEGAGPPRRKPTPPTPIASDAMLLTD